MHHITVKFVGNRRLWILQMYIYAEHHICAIDSYDWRARIRVHEYVFCYHSAIFNSDWKRCVFGFQCLHNKKILFKSENTMSNFNTIFGSSAQIIQEITVSDEIQRIPDAAFKGFTCLLRVSLNPNIYTIGPEFFFSAVFSFVKSISL